MAFCYHRGEEIEFINNGFSPIPIHPSGSCSGRAGGYGSGGGYSVFRSTRDGEVFEFPFITYPQVCGGEGDNGREMILRLRNFGSRLKWIR
jgi:hypothetical protein